MGRIIHIEIDPETKEIIKDLLSEMEKPVIIKLFTSDYCDDKDINWCVPTEEFLNLLKELAPEGKIVIEKYTPHSSLSEFKRYNIDESKVPTICLGDCWVKYVGAPLGEEVKSFIKTIITISSGKTSLKPSTREALNELNNNVEIITLVTPACPYCPEAAYLANLFAIESRGRISSIIVDASMYPEIAYIYAVTAVPAIIIKRQREEYGALEFIGVPAEHDLLEKILEYGR